MTYSQVLHLSTVGFISGVLHGYVGVAADCTMAWTIADYGVHPSVNASTTVFIAMITSATCTISVLVFERINVPFAVMYWVMTVVGAVPGTLVMPKLAGWVKRPHIF
jgi:uncharacterized membrane protein YfcA